MKTLLPTLLAASLMTGGIGLTQVVTASDYEHRGDHHKGQHDGHHGGGYRHGHKVWMKGMSDEQRGKIDKLHKEYRSKKYDIKHKMKDVKATLMEEVTRDKTDQKAIDKKIEAILKLKREKLQLKVAHKIEVRKLLNAEQKKQFDEHVMNRAKSCHKGKRHH